MDKKKQSWNALRYAMGWDKKRDGVVKQLIKATGNKETQPLFGLRSYAEEVAKYVNGLEKAYQKLSNTKYYQIRNLVYKL